ncbi:MAG: pilin, partial [bacterium]
MHNRRWILAIALACTTVVFLVLTVTVVRAVSFENPSTSLGLGTSDLKATVINIINWALGLLGLLAVGLMIYGGFLWLTSGGSEDRIRRAKKILINTLIGLVIILLSWAIVNFVLNFTNNVTNPGNTTCTDGDVQGCFLCTGGTWVYSNSIPGCTLPQDTFEIRDIVTSCENLADYRDKVYKCSGVTVVFNKVLDATTVDQNTNNDNLTVEQCGANSDFSSCISPSQPTPLFNQTPPFVNEIEYSGAVPKGDRAEIVASGKALTFLHAQEDFASDTFYRMTIPKASQGLKSDTGLPLTGCKHADGSAILGCVDGTTYYSW